MVASGPLLPLCGMMLVGLALLLVALISPISASLSFVDLTYTQNFDAPASHQVKVLQSDQNYINIMVEVSDMCGRQEVGTYLDAPSHSSNGSWFVDQIPLERLLEVPGVVIDVEGRVRRSGDRRYAVTASDLEAEVDSLREALPDGAVVLLHTGWEKWSHDLKYYLGYDENDTDHYPGISEDGAEWLSTYGSRRRQKVGVVGVGIDTASVDVGGAQDDPARAVLHAHNIYSLHNLKNLDKLIRADFRVTAAPLKIGGGDVASARVVASIGRDPLPPGGEGDSSSEEEGPSFSSSCPCRSSSWRPSFDGHDDGWDRDDDWPYGRDDGGDQPPISVSRDYVLLASPASAPGAEALLTAALTALAWSL